MPIIVEGITTERLGRSIGDWVKAATIETGYRVLREEVGKGFDNEPVVITDGVTRRAPEEVRPFGKIEFTARPQMAEAVRWALTELEKRSPVLTGRYASSHLVMINGVAVQGDIWAALRAVKSTDRVQIVNTQPYARKIEGATANKHGRGKRKPSSRQAKSGVYRAVLTALVARYGRSMFFDYKIVKLNLGVKVWGDQGGSYYNRLKKNGGGWVKHHVKRVQRDQVYPCLQFFLKSVDLSSAVASPLN